MELNLTVGLKGEKRERVTAEKTAAKYGSGSLAVYATPAMVGLMEGAAVEAVDKLLPEGMSTVGTELKIQHKAATPVGMEVRAEAELVEIDGRRLVFAVKAFDEKEEIGAGTHERFIIKVEKFLAKVEGKRQR